MAQVQLQSWEDGYVVIFLSFLPASWLRHTSRSPHGLQTHSVALPQFSVEGCMKLGNTWDCKIDSSVGFTSGSQGRWFPGSWSWFREWLSNVRVKMSATSWLCNSSFNLCHLTDVQDRWGGGKAWVPAAVLLFQDMKTFLQEFPVRRLLLIFTGCTRDHSQLQERMGKESNIVMIDRGQWQPILGSLHFSSRQKLVLLLRTREQWTWLRR